ncbi:hypothetical protein MJO28_013127 [Puccinia striiformis f. sp. tritici]|uniref:Uncharacterized protein n=1 Tax=Puccinia striiformis f. sp. tritici TaxID=168172 RepID=A0ACC0E0B2_9BASI|nr:hypothetical protein MJO28_013127 [Puccinia striiformis f. sp. tritici]
MHLYCLTFWITIIHLSAFSAAARFAPRSPPQHYHGNIRGQGSYRLIADSNICETTPGVHTYSGYINISQNHSMFFWFFEARNNPKTAPFTLWLNGGPGCSSLVGAFQENGPCRVNAQGNSTTLNPYSWNTYAHVLYLDQPIPAGFSYGIHDVNSTSQAAPRVWEFFQILFSIPHFVQYQSRELSFWTESYGGQYAADQVSTMPKLALIFPTSQYFERQNSLIKSKKIEGHLVHPTSLGITTGWFDPLYHYSSYYDYAQVQYNGLKDLVDPDVLVEIKAALDGPRGCVAQIKQCEQTGDNSICRSADAFCTQKVSTPAMGDRGPYFFENPKADPFPLHAYVKYLSMSEVTSAIGAESKFTECADGPYKDFTTTGDDARSSTPALAKLLNKGLRTVIWAGDRDFICNTLGGYRSISAMDWQYADEFRKAPWTMLRFKGQDAGRYKKAGPLTYITVFGAGHQIPAYKPQLALEVFKQTIFHEDIHST